MQEEGGRGGYLILFVSLTRLNERRISRVRQRLDDGEVPERPILDSNLNLIARPGNDLCGVCTVNFDAVVSGERSVTQKRMRGPT